MRNIVRSAVVGAALAAALPAAQADAAVLIVNLAGIETFDAFGDANNIVQTYNIGAGAHVTGAAYNVSLTTIGGSYLSEASIYYTNSAITEGVVTRPGFANANSGSGTFTGNSDLVALGLDFFVGADGVLRLEFAESFDDNPNAADATFTAGTISFTYEPAATGNVPEPATWAMMLAGFGLVGVGLRRRSAAKPAVVHA